MLAGKWWMTLLLLLVSGCGGYSQNMRLGTDQSYLSIGDQRHAVQTVKVFDATPEGAVELGTVDASRCHRYTSDVPPTEDHVLLDLKVAAFARGADGISNVRIEKDSGLHRNCWFILTGTATMFTLQEHTGIDRKK